MLKGGHIGPAKACYPLFVACTPTIEQLAAKMKVILNALHSIE
jgi:hypothetical protein